MRLLTRNGYDWTGRFPLIAAAAETLRARSFLIDGEAVACDGDGLPVFDQLRYRRQDGRVFLYALTCSSSTGGTCGANRWRCASALWPRRCG